MELCGERYEIRSKVYLSIQLNHEFEIETIEIEREYPARIFLLFSLRYRISKVVGMLERISDSIPYLIL